MRYSQKNKTNIISMRAKNYLRKKSISKRRRKTRKKVGGAYDLSKELPVGGSRLQLQIQVSEKNAYRNVKTLPLPPLTRKVTTAIQNVVPG